jgi:hypothetical protein
VTVDGVSGERFLLEEAMVLLCVDAMALLECGIVDLMKKLRWPN